MIEFTTRNNFSVDDGAVAVYTDGENISGRYDMTTEAYKIAHAKYDRANTTQLKFKLNNKTDADVLQKLKEVGNKQGYIKSLIRADIANTSG